MRVLRIVVTWLVITALTAPAALAGDLKESAAKAVEHQTLTQTAKMPRPYLWAGSALFVGGMAVGIYAFLNNKNGSFPEFGEAEAVNTKLGVAGLATAFAGGTILFLGSRRAGAAPSVTISASGAKITKIVTWK
jgi:hypothetical protein